jgi:hypothetical protein
MMILMLRAAFTLFLFADRDGNGSSETSYQCRNNAINRAIIFKLLNMTRAVKTIGIDA